MRFRRQPSPLPPAPDPAEFDALPPASRAAAHLLRAEYQALAERNARLIRKFLTVFSIAYAVLALFLLGCGITSVILLGRSSADRGRLAAVQHTLGVSQKASTQTRVTTVGQRCQLTMLILGVLQRVHDTQDAAPFEASYQVCKTQLATVKRINAETPTPAKKHPKSPNP